MRNIFLLLILATFACTHQKSAAPEAVKRAVSTDPRTQKSHMELSYKDLSTILKTIEYTVDGHQLGCPVKPDQLASLSQSFRALLDERLEVDKQTYLKLPKQKRAHYFPKNCQDDCNCDAYIQFAEYLQKSDISLTASEKKSMQKISSTQIDSSRDPAICIQNEEPWVCDSKIFHSLTVE